MSRFAGTKQGRGIVDTSRWAATNHVGAISTPSLTVEVLPKVFLGETREDREKNRAHLLRILAFTDFIDIRESEISGKGLVSMDIYEIIRFLYSKRLLREAENGIHRAYETFEGNERFLKGRLDIAKNIRANHVLRDKFHISYDELTEDTPLNRTFRAATMQELPRSGNPSRRFLAPLSVTFSELSTDSPIGVDIQSAERKFNRTSLRFRPSFNIAKTIIGRTSPTTYIAKGSDIVDFTFEMDVLFEMFVAKFLKRFKDAFLPQPSYVFPQFTRHFGDLVIRPDVVIKTRDTTLVIDTKYTRLPTAQDKINEHLYQVYAYAMHAKESEPKKRIVGLLLYPHHLNTDAGLSDIQVGDPGSPYSVKIFRKKLDLAAAPGAFVKGYSQQFRRIFASVGLS